MDIIKEITSWASKGVYIDHYIINQIDNGNQSLIDKGVLPIITYTINVMDGEELIFKESFDHLDVGYKKALAFCVNYYEKGDN